MFSLAKAGYVLLLYPLDEASGNSKYKKICFASVNFLKGTPNHDLLAGKPKSFTFENTDPTA